METFMGIILIVWGILSWILDKLAPWVYILSILLFFFACFKTLWKESQSTGLLVALMVTVAVGTGYFIGKSSGLSSSWFYTIFILVLVVIYILIFTFKDKAK